MARYLYDRLPAATEGDLTLLRTWLVRASTLADWARELELDTFVRLGRSDESTSRRTKLMARTFEAVVGAIYLERGVRGVTAFLRPFVTRELKTRFAGPTPLDAKSRLQQVSQSRFEEVPTYHVVEVTGPGHDPWFTVEVRVGPSLVRAGTGGTKQEAEQAAASQALEDLETMPEAAADEIGTPDGALHVTGGEALSAPDTLD
ncbi:MAG: ribonuclease 3 [Chloroflexi bacterium]|nr:ribonuclease 3 [Chloroflexota bacterium]